MIPEKYLRTLRRINPKYFQVVLSFILFIWVAFFLFGKEWHGLTWVTLCLFTFALFFLTVLNLYIKRPMIQTSLFPYILLACILGNIVYFRVEKIPPIKQLSSNSFSAFLKTTTKSEVINLAAGLYPYLAQSTLVVNPGQLNLAGMSTEELLYRRVVKEIRTTSHPITLTIDQAENMLNLPHVEWGQLDGGVYYLIEPKEIPTTYFLVRMNTDWFLIPEKYFDEDQQEYIDG